ncbi:MAG: AraC family transcriptional regulator [Eubacteriales bacterium]|nr:AraC family transcriptional regulator [Eubacteriales bacterium]
MEREGLYRRIKEYTPIEKQILSGAPTQEEIPAFGHPADGDTLCFSMNEFISSGETIGIHRQDRFVEVAPHTHDYIELAYMWSGSCIQEIEGQKQQSLEGDVCIFDTQAVHSFGRTGEDDIVVNILMHREFFDAAFLTRLSGQGILSEFLVDSVTKSRKKRHYLYFQTHGNQAVRRIMEQILLEYYTQDLGNRQVIESYLVILFTELLRSMRDTSKEAKEREQADICELLSYIEKNYEHCTLTDMAEYFGFNRNYLTGLLKERTGRSFLEHVQEQKLKKACALLKHTDLPIQEIVSLSGYANLNFFYKKFREAEGCTPAAYRKQRNPVT